MDGALQANAAFESRRGLTGSRRFSPLHMPGGCKAQTNLLCRIRRENEAQSQQLQNPLQAKRAQNSFPRQEAQPRAMIRAMAVNILIPNKSNEL
ncbi:unnamed protein product [Protopolystoma xenopodis]|uniref:Uncharacterized protein n=1 Tax=Protopolystoma xenopodis TaxID=117903 RepID=A0A3S5C2F6_9PLAT|nr:unnamed protein product [Protopolystoma xenopodis]